MEGLFTVTVLPGYSQGMTMRFRTPRGTVCTVQIPEGINAGDSFRVAVPEEGTANSAHHQLPHPGQHGGGGGSQHHPGIMPPPAFGGMPGQQGGMTMPGMQGGMGMQGGPNMAGMSGMMPGGPNSNNNTNITNNGILSQNMGMGMGVMPPGSMPPNI